MLTLAKSGGTITGFVERVGDRVPLVTADGASYLAEQLLVEALDGMVELGGGPSTDVAIAVPAHWNAATTWALRSALATSKTLAQTARPVRVVSDAVAALTALQANPGIAADGVVALLDFGGSGTSVTLADAAAQFEPVGETVRVADFSGDLIDQALLTHVLDNLGDNADPAGTTAVESLAKLRDECRRAKERLSAETATQLVLDLPGYRTDIRVTRDELEELIRRPLDGVTAALDELTERNGIAPTGLTAVAIVGGGASIPLVAQRISEHTQLPLVTTPRPALDAAVGQRCSRRSAPTPTHRPGPTRPPPWQPTPRPEPPPPPPTRPSPVRCTTSRNPTRARRRFGRWRGRRRKAATTSSRTPAKTPTSCPMLIRDLPSSTCRPPAASTPNTGRGTASRRWWSASRPSSPLSPSAAWPTR
ncbi:hypothetical protein MAGR_44230 [Mycolicibacterium agri]|uniref:Molecular chaperone n=1 Tax=Mycolicibacterium agri TaxID=36811 RepID=A0A7I9W5L4_MYCAG|nr:hypothetical protein MAGR_44230 [Mycolicibacterium agri]